MRPYARADGGASQSPARESSVLNEREMMTVFAGSLALNFGNDRETAAKTVKADF
jgi:hypothetical protein